MIVHALPTVHTALPEAPGTVTFRMKPLLANAHYFAFLLVNHGFLTCRSADLLCIVAIVLNTSFTGNYEYSYGWVYE